MTLEATAPTRATVTAPSNIAFVKYWGARDLARALPVNPSISMTLSSCVTRTTAELLPAGVPGARDEVLLVDDDGRAAPAPEAFARRALAHVERLRAWAGRSEKLRVATRNSFPAAAGIASSASGFAALTLAVVRAFGREPSAEELSSLARESGSGSAARSVLGGYVEWPAGDIETLTEAQAHAVPLAPASHWDLADVVALVETGPKAVSSLGGHELAPTSPYFERRLTLLPGRLERVRRAIRERDFDLLAPVLEEEAIDLHLIAMSSSPPVFYWAPGTLEVLAAVRELRAEGVAAACTMDAGANVHVICPVGHEPAVAERIAALSSVHGVIRDRVGSGPTVETEHLV